MGNDGLKYLGMQLKRLAKKEPYSYMFREFASRKLANSDTPVDALIVSIIKKYKNDNDFYGGLPPVISKEDVIAAFQKFEDIGLGKYKRVYKDKKPRFEWQNFSCINIGKYAMDEAVKIEVYDTDLTYFDQLVVDMNDGRQCFIRLPYGFDKTGNKWKRFLGEISDWADDELKALA